MVKVKVYNDELVLNRGVIETDNKDLGSQVSILIDRFSNDYLLSDGDFDLAMAKRIVAHYNDSEIEDVARITKIDIPKTDHGVIH